MDKAHGLGFVGAEVEQDCPAAFDKLLRGVLDGDVWMGTRYQSVTQRLPERDQDEVLAIYIYSLTWCRSVPLVFRSGGRLWWEAGDLQSRH